MCLLLVLHASRWVWRFLMLIGEGRKCTWTCPLFTWVHGVSCSSLCVKTKTSRTKQSQQRARSAKSSLLDHFAGMLLLAFFSQAASVPFEALLEQSRVSGKFQTNPVNPWQARANQIEGGRTTANRKAWQELCETIPLPCPAHSKQTGGPCA